MRGSLLSRLAMDRFVLLILSPYIFLLVHGQTCYWPNGSKLPASNNYTACATTGDSQCCANGHACLSNGLCFNPVGGSVYRGACTDSSWSTSACPQYCNTMSNFKQSSVTLAPCPPDANGLWRWWCGQEYTNVCGTADQNTSIFDYPKNAYILKVAGTTNVTSSTSSATAASGTSSGAPLSQATLCANESDKVSKTTTIGVGVGVGLAMATVAAAMATLFWKERKRRIIAERLGYGGQAMSYAKQSDEKVLSSPAPVYELAPQTARAQLPGSESAR